MYCMHVCKAKHPGVHANTYVYIQCMGGLSDMCAQTQGHINRHVTCVMRLNEYHNGPQLTIIIICLAKYKFANALWIRRVGKLIATYLDVTVNCG